MPSSQSKREAEDPPPDELVLFCGMSIGFEDDTVHHARTGRAPLDETVTFVTAR